MKATITYISKAGDYAKVAIEQEVGPVISSIAGWMKLANKKARVNDTFDIPAGTKVRQEQQGDYVALVFS